MRMMITSCFFYSPMEVERSLVEQRIVLSHELATNTLRGGRFHDHYRNLETQRNYSLELEIIEPCQQSSVINFTIVRK